MIAASTEAVLTSVAAPAPGTATTSPTTSTTTSHRRVTAYWTAAAPTASTVGTPARA